MTERTELQELFLEHLFGDARGDYRKAAQLAGYSDKTIMKSILKPLNEEILLRANTYLGANAPKAVFTLEGILENPSFPGAREALAASKEILDRTGLAKQETLALELNVPNSLFILPAKKEDEDA